MRLITLFCATFGAQVMNQIQSRKQSRRLGRYPIDTIIRIQVGMHTHLAIACLLPRLHLTMMMFIVYSQPSSRQCNNAASVIGIGKPDRTAIPMFTADGLKIQRANGEVRCSVCAYCVIIE